MRTARSQVSPTARFYLEHVRGDQEPLLWVADIVAGAVRAAYQGKDPQYREALAQVVYEVEITGAE